MDIDYAIKSLYFTKNTLRFLNRELLLERRFKKWLSRSATWHQAPSGGHFLNLADFRFFLNRYNN